MREIGILMQSSGRLQLIKNAIAKSAKPFELAYGPLPYNRELTKIPGVPKIGGGAFWVTRNHQGLRAFINYMIRPEVQLKWTQTTGYLPVTQEAHHKLQKENYFDNPALKIATLQVTQRSASFLTHFLLRDYAQIRSGLFLRLFYKHLAKKEMLGKNFLEEFCQQANYHLEKKQHLSHRS